jgi:two-component system sensor histidine kinase KdpD
MSDRRRTLFGLAVALLALAGLSAVMLGWRSHLSVATSALVLVIPVVVGVAVGGFRAGAVTVVAGFLVYDYVFIPPYYTLSVGSSQNWVALGVYAAVMLIVAQVTARLEVARARAQQRQDEARRMFELSELLVGERSVDEMLETIVMTVQQAFNLTGVTLLMPVGGRLEVVRSAGEAPTDGDLQQLDPHSSTPVSLSTAIEGREQLHTVALSASGRPVGLLVLRGLLAAGQDRGLLRTFANHLALALERAQLHEQAVRAEGLEEVDRLRRSLVSAVSHDLRTPLATIKIAASSLQDHDDTLSRQDAEELLGLIDSQSDRLSRLVSNLLDMSRIQAGALDVRPEPIDTRDLIAESMAALGPSLGRERVRVSIVDDRPVQVDPILIVQVLANLLENAVRYAPEGAPIEVAVDGWSPEQVVVSVTDTGPGVVAGERDSIFLMFNRREAGGRAGLGLAIAAAFVEVHRQRIWVEDGPGGGARFAFTLPLAPSAGVPSAGQPVA